MKKFWEKMTVADIRNILAILYIVLVLGFLYVLAFHPVPAGNSNLVNILGGHVIAGSGIILGFFFGSSKRDSDDKKTV